MRLNLTIANNISTASIIICLSERHVAEGLLASKCKSYLRTFSAIISISDGLGLVIKITLWT